MVPQHILCNLCDSSCYVGLYPKSVESYSPQHCRQLCLVSAPPAMPSSFTNPCTASVQAVTVQPGAINCSSIKTSSDRSRPFPVYPALPWTLEPINPPFNRPHFGQRGDMSGGEGGGRLCSEPLIESQRNSLIRGCRQSRWGWVVSGPVKGRVSLPSSSRGPAAGRRPGRATQRSLKPPAQGPPQEPCQAQSSSN